MTRPIRDILAERALTHFVDRAPELSRLLGIFDHGGSLVTYIHGLAGVGKSTLLQAYAAQATARSITVIRLDARLFEPTADKLHELAPRAVLLIDSYEHLRLLDSWIGQNFVPSLHDSVRVVIASRYPPHAPWLIEPEWQGHFARIAKGHPLPLSLGSMQTLPRLAQLYLADAVSDDVRRAIEASSVLQRITQPLFGTS
ncbi:MAG: hypothetical protein NTV52_05580 [Acidobacteria bacterium]|nr:hypothetical protein [Acidobacteriota bacterium]